MLLRSGAGHRLKDPCLRQGWPQTRCPISLSVPVAQEWSADLNRTLSRREKKKTSDGVTLTGINQTGDQPLQNKPSRWAPGSLNPLRKVPWVLRTGQDAPSTDAGQIPQWGLAENSLHT